MDHKKTLIAIALFAITLLAGSGVAFFVIRSKQPLEETTTPSTQATPTLTVQSPPSTLRAGETTTLDIYVNTFGASIEGFQFIATLDGSSTPTVQDTDTTIAGTQIQAVTSENLTTATNSVVEQGGKQVLRYAMITEDSATGFSTEVPVKIASVTVSPSAAGSLRLEFNPQNTRASRSGQEDVLIAASDASYVVAASTVTATPLAISTPSGKLLGASTSASTTSPLIAATTSTSSSSLTTSVSTASATATPRPTATPIATDTGDLATTTELPQSGSVGQTLALLLGGILFVTVGIGIHLAFKEDTDTQSW